MSGPPLESRQDTIQTKDIPSPRIDTKIPDPAGNRIRAATGLEDRDSTDHERRRNETLISNILKCAHISDYNLFDNMTIITMIAPHHSTNYFSLDRLIK